MFKKIIIVFLLMFSCSVFAQTDVSKQLTKIDNELREIYENPADFIVSNNYENPLIIIDKELMEIAQNLLANPQANNFEQDKYEWARVLFNLYYVLDIYKYYLTKGIKPFVGGSTSHSPIGYDVRGSIRLGVQYSPITSFEQKYIRGKFITNEKIDWFLKNNSPGHLSMLKQLFPSSNDKQQLKPVLNDCFSSGRYFISFPQNERSIGYFENELNIN